MTDAPPPPPADGYLLDNRSAEAGLRFDSLGALFNPVTFGHLERLGVGPGSTCWEVGAGGPSVSTWLSDRVGPTGRVVATDIDTRWALPSGATQPANLEVRRHDVASDVAPEGRFDLVHERLVLIHLPGRIQALSSMVGALRPGGWVLVEDFDSLLQPFACPDEVGPGQQLANRIRLGFRALLAARGAQLDLGRQLPRLLRAAGLIDVGADAYAAVASPAAIALEQANVAQVREALVAGGHATELEIDDYDRALERGDLDIATAPLISAWGRRPSAA
jgi:hypothetical protein